MAPIDEVEGLGGRPGGSLVPSRVSGASHGPREVWVEIPDPNGNPAAWCYTDEKSYSPGDAVKLRISATVDEIIVRVRKYHRRPSDPIVEARIATTYQSIPDRVFEVGCDWESSLTIELPVDIDPGVYLVELAGVGSERVTPLGHHLFVVRPTVARQGAIALFLATNTWTAYNDWGGANHYYGENEGVLRGRSPILSTRRPWARGQAWLPDGAPRVLNPVRPREPENSRYTAIEWAALNGYSKYYASAGWPTYERHFVSWAEAQGYTVDVYTQDDLQFRPELISQYACTAFVGHDEYWTAQMRDTVDAYVDEGGKVMRLAGNFMWQIRLEDDGHRQVAYKYDAREKDPVGETDPSAVTAAWEDPQVSRPGAQTFGVNALRGLYAGWGGMAPRAARGFIVFQHEHWAFGSTGLGYADMIGDESNVFGYEVDGLEYTFTDGLPTPMHTDGAPDNLQILAMNWATSAEYGLPEHTDSHMLGDGDARYMTEIMGERSEDDVKRRARTSGMIVNFTRGEGEVFTVGACEWVNGLRLRDFYVEAITNNVLRRFLNETQNAVGAASSAPLN